MSNLSTIKTGKEVHSKKNCGECELGSFKDHWTTITTNKHFGVLCKIWYGLVFLGNVKRVFELLEPLIHHFV